MSAPGPKIRAYLIFKYLIMNAKFIHCKKKRSTGIELYQNKNRSVIGLVLLAGYYRYFNCFSLAILQSDVFFVLTAEQRAKSRDISFLCHPVIKP